MTTASTTKVGEKLVKLYVDTADRVAAESLLGDRLVSPGSRPILRSCSVPRKVLLISNEIYRWAIDAGAERSSLKLGERDSDTLIERGVWLRGLGREVVVKFVATRAGATACAALAARGAPTLLTAIYDPGQALVAAAAGATYIAPYLGRMNDAGRDGISEVVAMHEVLVATGSDDEGPAGQHLVSVSDMVALARHGVDCFTMAPGGRRTVLHRSDDCGGCPYLRRSRSRDISMITESDVDPAVVVAGDALIDLTPTTTVRGHLAYEPHPGGSCLNVAVGLGRLGVPTAFLARLSTDAFGQMLRTQLADSGVQPTYFVDTDDLTTLAAVHLRGGGRRRTPSMRNARPTGAYCRSI